jgi:replicative DNA helicase
MNQEIQDPNKLWSRAAEGGVLGSMMLDRAAIPAALERITETDFFAPENRRIFRAIVKLYQEGEVDGLLVREALAADNNPGNAIAVEYLQKVLNSVPSSANAGYYAKIIKEKSDYRKIIQAIADMDATLSDTQSPPEEQVERIQRIALALPQVQKLNRVHHLKAASEIALLAQNKNLNLVSTGFNNVDYYISGVAPGEMICLAGRPGMGKSGLALNMAVNMTKQGKSVVYITLEMTGASLIERAIASEGRVNLRQIRITNPAQENLNRFYAASMELEKLDMTLREDITTVERLLSVIELQNQIKPVDCVFLDYIQLMSAGEKSNSRYEEVTKISGSIKRAAMRLHIPIIALSQLSRAGEGRTDRKPRMSDLRDSGAIEQDADIIMLLHREDYYRARDAQKDGLAELDIAKNRRGPTGWAKLAFLEEYVLFGDYNECEEPGQFTQI